jgi:spore coat polysaccharide biosynthesis protein SpsF
MKVVVIVQARLKSKRLQKKVLCDLYGQPVLSQIVKRCQAAKTVHEVVVACPAKDELEIFEHTGLCPIPGPEKDLLTRILYAADKTKADLVVRVTADCPLVDPDMIDFMVDALRKTPTCYFITNWIRRKYPDGADLEIYRTSFLREVSSMLKDEGDREYFAQWVSESVDPQHIFSIECDTDCSHYRVTLDYPADLEVIRRIYAAQGNDLWSMNEVVRWLDKHPEVMKLNRKYADGTFGRKPT